MPPKKREKLPLKGSRKRIALWRAPRPKRERVVTSVRVAWPRP